MLVISLLSAVQRGGASITVVYALARLLGAAVIFQAWGALLGSGHVRGLKGLWGRAEALAAGCLSGRC